MGRYIIALLCVPSIVWAQDVCPFEGEIAPNGSFEFCPGLGCDWKGQVYWPHHFAFAGDTQRIDESLPPCNIQWLASNVSWWHNGARSGNASLRLRSAVDCARPQGRVPSGGRTRFRAAVETRLMNTVNLLAITFWVRGTSHAQPYVCNADNYDALHEVGVLWIGPNGLRIPVPLASVGVIAGHCESWITDEFFFEPFALDWMTGADGRTWYQLVSYVPPHFADLETGVSVLIYADHRQNWGSLGVTDVLIDDVQGVWQ